MPDCAKAISKLAASFQTKTNSDHFAVYSSESFFPTNMPVRITRVSCEHYETGLGISCPTPRLSWRFEGDAFGWTQTSYALIIRRGTVENHHIIDSNSVLVPWPSSPLRSRESVEVEVQAMGSDGSWTSSSTLVIEAGLFTRDDWAAQVVTGANGDPDQPKKPYRVGARFHCPTGFRSARLYITSLGVHEPWLNGVRIGDELLAPGWTDYRYQLRYSVHDISAMLNPGEINVFGAWIGEGWYAGRLGFRDGVRNVYGSALGLLAQIEVDGSIIARSDLTWRWSHGNIVSSELMDGEIFDSNIDDNWSGLEGWSPVTMLPFPTSTLLTAEAPPVREIRHIVATDLFTTLQGKTIIDFGQNFAGYVRILGEPPRTTGKVVLRYAEVMEKGELGTRPLRAAKCTDTIILGGTVRGYKAKFTNHGFRYLEIVGWPDVSMGDIEGILISSNMERTGHFECSHETLNQLHSNVVHSTLANTISLPTDCPQRDERLGWTGDLQVFAPSLNFLFESSGFLRDWLKDLYEDQKALGGHVPVIVPTLPLEGLMGLCQGVWGDAAIITPWDLYLGFGDRQILKDQFASMCLWLDEGVRREPDTQLWSRKNPQLGDWLDPSAPPSLPGRGRTDPLLVADAYLVHATKLAAKVAELLNQTDTAIRYQSQSRSLLQAFHSTYITAKSRVISDSQTAHALLLHFDLLDESKPEQRGVLSRRLEELVIREFWQVSTGFVGTPIILDTLANHDMLHHAYRMLLARDCPSWLSPVLLGATTIWERWDSMLSDGSINSGNMTSFNHYALGAVANFLHTIVGGISHLEPGWKRILIRPQPGGNLSWAKTSYLSVYGLVRCNWHINSGFLHVECQIPPNCQAQVEIPGRESVEVGSGIWDFKVDWRPDERFPPDLVQPEFSRPVDKDWVR